MSNAFSSQHEVDLRHVEPAVSAQHLTSHFFFSLKPASHAHWLEASSTTHVGGAGGGGEGEGLVSSVGEGGEGGGIGGGAGLFVARSTGSHCGGGAADLTFASLLVTHGFVMCGMKAAATPMRTTARKLEALAFAVVSASLSSLAAASRLTRACETLRQRIGTPLVCTFFSHWATGTSSATCVMLSERSLATSFIGMVHSSTMRVAGNPSAQLLAWLFILIRAGSEPATSSLGAAVGFASACISDLREQRSGHRSRSDSSLGQGENCRWGGPEVRAWAATCC